MVSCLFVVDCELAALIFFTSHPVIATLPVTSQLVNRPSLMC